MTCGTAAHAVAVIHASTAAYAAAAFLHFCIKRTPHAELLAALKAAALLRLFLLHAMCSTCTLLALLLQLTTPAPPDAAGRDACGCSSWSMCCLLCSARARLLLLALLLQLLSALLAAYCREGCTCQISSFLLAGLKASYTFLLAMIILCTCSLKSLGLVWFKCSSIRFFETAL